MKEHHRIVAEFREEVERARTRRRQRLACLQWLLLGLFALLGLAVAALPSFFFAN
jgi:hypothetical protein